MNEHYRYNDCKERGRFERLDYIAINVKGERIPKYCNVYTPYGYEEETDKKYNILYLMHGGGGNPDAWMDSCPLKNLFDNLHAEGLVEPTIVVLPTFYTDGNASEGMAGQREFTINFQAELVRDLMPAVESHYRTYAETADEAGFKASRMHRAFGGFSMGSVNTWMSFGHNLDYFAYFMPISGDCWELEQMGGNKQPEATAKFLHDAAVNGGYTNRDFFIYASTGTKDIAYENLTPQMEAMKAFPDTFAFTEDDFTTGNVRYDAIPDYVHAYQLVFEYVGNSMPKFFRN